MDVIERIEGEGEKEECEGRHAANLGPLAGKEEREKKKDGDKLDGYGKREEESGESFFAPSV